MKILWFLSIIFLFSFSVFAQKTQPTPPQSEDTDVVKISTALVQIDAVVTDKKGNQVTDLTADDFELLQNGKPQSITNFSYVNAETGKQTQTFNAKKSDKKIPLPPPVVSRRSTELRRVLTFVVDDGSCALTLLGLEAAKEGLEKFVNEQMLPNDLIAIYQTRRGSSLLQQYTSDKTRLLSIIRKFRWYPPAGICSPAGGDPQTRNEGTLREEGSKTFETGIDRERREAADNFDSDRQITGLIGVVRYAINGLRPMGGRKVLFLMSEALAVTDGKGIFFNSLYPVREVTELANRSSVVINSIDMRGLVVPGADASAGFRNEPNIMASGQSNDSLRQSGLAFVANETGGKFYKNMNFLHNPIREALKIEKGYYLIGYQPEEETFKGKKFHKIEIKLKRPDLVVSSRSGFSNLTDTETSPKPRTGDRELYDAIIAPLPNAGLDLRLTAFFGNTATEGNFVRTLLYLDGEQLTFTDEPGGMKKAVFDVIAVTLNEKNVVIDEFNRTHTIRFPAANLTEVRQKGVIYSADVPVKKAGVYSFRVAVRDAASKLLGSASQQIEVPDLKKDKIFLSGITLGEVTIKDGKAVIPSIEKSENAFAPVAAVSIPAIRRFRPGAILGYSYKIYNAHQDKSTKQPKLTVQVRLYRDGQLISDSKPQETQFEPQTDLTRISDYGYMKLPPGTATGDYALQIIIKDLQDNETTSQWIDFEIIK